MAAALLPLLAGCATKTADAASGACRPAAAAALVGRAAPSDTALLRRTGAASVRRIAPGDMVTQDYRPERLTVTVGADGRIRAAGCG